MTLVPSSSIHGWRSALGLSVAEQYMEKRINKPYPASAGNGENVLAIQGDGDRKLEAAREQRKKRSQRASGGMKRITTALPINGPEHRMSPPRRPFLAGDWRLGSKSLRFG